MSGKEGATVNESVVLRVCLIGCVGMESLKSLIVQSFRFIRPWRNVKFKVDVCHAQCNALVGRFTKTKG